MWSTAVLAVAFGTREADAVGEFAPFDRIKPAVRRSDRHEERLKLAVLGGNPKKQFGCLLINFG
jgi:hypothetical protein